MRLLLDTHILVWSLISSSHLPAAARHLLADRRNAVHFSPVSVLEVAIKRSSGSRSAPAVPSERLVELARAAGFSELPLSSVHAAALETLAVAHPDPFDRLILAQAKIEGLQLLTHDETLAGFDNRAILI